jgi:hypothetical protein
MATVLTFGGGIRMKKCLLLVVALFALASFASATVCDFDALPGDGVVPDGYCSITWGGVWNYYGESQPPYNPSSPPNRVYDFVTHGTFSFDSGPVVFNGAYFSGFDFAPVTFNLYNGATLVWTSATLVPSGVPTWLASGYGGLVTSVDVFSPTPDFFVMDDVTYGGTIPEPGSIALFATGALGAIGAVRRRFAK